MGTKVKGDAIKEGSIPLSALATEVKDKIENAGGADWNAKEGEAGYIENKPITKKFIKEQSMEFSDVNEWSSIYEGYEVVPSNTTVARVFADITTYGGEHITTTVIVQKGSYVDILENDEGDYLRISMYNDPEELTMSVSATSFSFSGTLKCYYYEEFKQLDEDYIPDTVLKTTPQTLSDEDKNQALANLGIDPVVWKYICNPHIVDYESDSGSFSNPIPRELSDIIYQNGIFNHLVLSTVLIKIHDQNEEGDTFYRVERITSYNEAGNIMLDNEGEFGYNTKTRLFVV